jgi:hypothetical protein
MLKYVGNGSLADIPARDLTDDEVRQFGEAFLLSTGLYVKVEVKQSKALHENKNLQPESEDKGCSGC